MQYTMMRSTWQLTLFMIACVIYCAAGACGSRVTRHLTQDAGAGIAAVKEQHLQTQQADQTTSAAGTESAAHPSLTHNYDDYALETLGDKYSSEDGDLYFNSKTGALDDVYGDYAFAQPEEHSSCKLGPNGVPILDGAYKGMCDLQLTGANVLAPLLHGGLDGIYKLHTCEHGRPAFSRITGPAEEPRLLWYSTKHKDWDVSNGTKPDELDILLYGGEHRGDLRPEHVPQDSWLIAAEFHPNADASVDYVPADVLVQCTAKHKEVAKPDPSAAVKERPYLTAQEMEQQYRSVINKAVQAKNQQDTGRHFGTGSMLALIVLGVLVCLCLPRVLSHRNIARRRRADGKGVWVGLTQLSGGRQVAED